MILTGYLTVDLLLKYQGPTLSLVFEIKFSSSLSDLESVGIFYKIQGEFHSLVEIQDNNFILRCLRHFTMTTVNVITANKGVLQKICKFTVIFIKCNKNGLAAAASHHRRLQPF